MRACLSTIQQTLTPEAATVLNHSIAEAGRRNHGHTTPLHVAAVLLSSTNGLLRQACIRSHPNSSHPLQCRALELCFSVALDRLPTTTTTVDADSSPSSDEPPISNALMAALKRAQAHQRRGCPEQQQQPLLAVKVELEQFIVSILDDPSVSPVMREASFSSPAVKSVIEHSLMSSSSSSHNSTYMPSPVVPKIGLGFGPMSRSLYLNPRLQPQQGLISNPGDDVRKVIEILSRTRKKNPVLVGESEPEIVLREVLRRIENKELGETGPLRNVEVITVHKEKETVGLRELGVLIHRKMMTMNSSVGLIIDLGDLKWLVDHQPPSLGLGHQGVSEASKEAVSEIGKIIGRYRGEDGNRLWVIGTATCETYLRCQVYHPSMENEWDLQAVSIAAKSPLHAKFPRLATNGTLGGSAEPYSSLKSLPVIMHPITRNEISVSQNFNPSRRLSCCPQCLKNYEHELAGLSDKPVLEVQSETRRKELPQWLQNAKIHNKDENKDEDPTLKQKSQELMKKWSDRCELLHPSFHQNGCLDRINPKPLSLSSLYANPNLFRREPFQPTRLGDDLRLNTISVSSQPMDALETPPGSPVRTDLVLGHTNTIPESATQKTHVDQPSDKPLDADSFKRLLKGLIEKVWWQRDAASSVTTTITRCKLGNGRRRSNGAKGDIWMMFSGPDRTGKKKMAFALSELVCGVDPVTMCLGLRRDREDSDTNFRGKTVLDRIAEAVRRNPFSVIMLQDIDEADMLVRGSIKRAMERGRFTDSYGREISLGNIIFILTTNNGHELDEEKLVEGVTAGWQLKLSVGNRKGIKRNLGFENEDEERAPKKRLESFDLNETANIEEDIVNGSNNSSDMTVEYEEEKTEFLDLVDENIVFKPVDFGLLKKNVESTIKARFRAVVGEKMSICIGNEALDKILGGAWLGKIGLESWVEQVLAPTINQIKTRLTTLPPGEHAVARLEIDDKSETRDDGDWLPNRVGLSVSVVGG